MAYKDLLVHVDDAKSSGTVDAAIGLAIAHDAHLVGVYVVTDPSPSSFVQGYLPPDVLDMLQRQARERADAARPSPRSQSATRSPSRPASTGCSTPRWPRRSANARYADLVIPGRPIRTMPTCRTCPRR